MTNIALIRHAPTQHNRNGIIMGSIDCVPDLDAYRDKIEGLVDELAPYEFAEIYSSPLLRALQTAQLVFSNRHIIIDDRLKERYFGLWEGKKKSAIKLQFPECFDENGNTIIHSSPESGEPFESFAQRVLPFLFEVNRQFDSNTNIAVFTHGGVIAFIQEFSQTQIDTKDPPIRNKVEHLVPYWINLDSAIG